MFKRGISRGNGARADEESRHGNLECDERVVRIACCIPSEKMQTMNNQDLKQESWYHSRYALQCHLCAPREPNNEHRLFIAQLSVSTLYLFRDQRFRGYSLLTYDSRHATVLEELSNAEYNAFMYDLRQAATAIRTALNPDHMNYECLGNSSPHLHWHIVPRYKNDPRWGNQFGKVGNAMNLL